MDSPAVSLFRRYSLGTRDLCAFPRMYGHNLTNSPDYNTPDFPRQAVRRFLVCRAQKNNRRKRLRDGADRLENLDHRLGFAVVWEHERWFRFSFRAGPEGAPGKVFFGLSAVWPALRGHLPRFPDILRADCPPAKG